MTRRCACCGEPFQARPQVPHQAYCAAPRCQRARKRRWQRARLQSDPDYRMNQRAAQKAWQERNQDYWRERRPRRPNDESTRDETPRRAAAKMDACKLAAGLYRIAPHPALPGEPGPAWVVKITPLCPACPCRMDASREDVIDTPDGGP